VRPEDRQGLAHQEVAVDMMPLEPQPAVLARGRIVTEDKKLVGLQGEVEPWLLDHPTDGADVVGTDVIDVAEHPQIGQADIRPIHRQPDRREVERRVGARLRRLFHRPGDARRPDRRVPGGGPVERHRAAIDEQGQFVVDVGQQQRPGSPATDPRHRARPLPLEHRTGDLHGTTGQIDPRLVAAPPLDQIKDHAAAFTPALEARLQSQIPHPVRSCRHRVIGLEIVDELRRRIPFTDLHATIDGLPVFGGGHEVAVAERGLPLAEGVDGVGAAAILGGPRRPVTRRAPIAPTQRPARLGELRRFVPRIMDTLEHRPKLGGGLARDPRVAPVAAGPDVATGDRHRFPGQTDETLDVVRLGVFGIAEDDHIEALRLGEVVGELADEDPVAVERRVTRIVFGAARRLGDQVHDMPAVGAARGGDEFAFEPGADLGELAMGRFDRLHRAPGLLAGGSRCPLIAGDGFGLVELLHLLAQLLAETLRLVILLGAAADTVVAATGLAGEILVPSHQGRGHRACGDDECLGLEGPEEEGEGEGDDDRLDRLAAESERTDHHVAAAQLRRGRHGGRRGSRRGRGPVLLDGHAADS